VTEPESTRSPPDSRVRLLAVPPAEMISRPPLEIVGATERPLE